MRTVIDIDDEQLGAAKSALGTRTKVETVNRALREVAAQAARRTDLARWTSGELSVVGDDDREHDAWR